MRFCSKSQSTAPRGTLLSNHHRHFSGLPSFFKTKVKVKQSHYDRPGEALGVPEGWGSKIQDNQHMKVERLSALRTGRLYPLEIFLVLISVRGWVKPRNIVRPGELCRWRIPVAQSGIKPATLRLIAHCLNRLRHLVPILFFSFVIWFHSFMCFFPAVHQRSLHEFYWLSIWADAGCTGNVPSDLCCSGNWRSVDW